MLRSTQHGKDGADQASTHRTIEQSSSCSCRATALTCLLDIPLATGQSISTTTTAALHGNLNAEHYYWGCCHPIPSHEPLSHSHVEEFDKCPAPPPPHPGVLNVLVVSFVSYFCLHVSNFFSRSNRPSFVLSFTRSAADGPSSLYTRQLPSKIPPKNNTMAPSAMPPVRPGFKRADTSSMGTKRKIICFSGKSLLHRLIALSLAAANRPKIAIDDLQRDRRYSPKTTTSAAVSHRAWVPRFREDWQTCSQAL